MKPADIHFAWRGWILGALFAILAYARWRSSAPVAAYGLIPLAAGILYRLYAGRYIPGHSNSLRLSGHALALGGPYRFGRHPLYLSNLAVIAGLILFAGCLPWWGAALMFGTAWMHHEFLARAEERYLVGLWGEAYRGYLRSTPRWLGLPRNIPGGAKPPIPSAARFGAETLAISWMRQGVNLGKGAVCALILWILAAANR